MQNKQNPMGLWCCRAMCLTVMLSGAGCASSALSASDQEKAQAALEKGLTAWKKGEPGKKWSSDKNSIRFVDNEWLGGYKLKDFQIVQFKLHADGYPEALVKLSVKPAKGPVLEKEALYTIHFKNQNQVIISRDPMF